MEERDRSRLFNKMKSDISLKRLYGSHQRFENELEKYKNKTFLTAEEQEKIKEIKMLKLRGVERMLSRLDKAA